MGRKRPFYELIYAPVVKDHLRAIESKYYSLIRSSIDEQLAYEPLVETKNRKPLKRSVFFGAGWELRFGPGNRFRVFYDVDQEKREVHVLAIGLKIRERLFIAGKEIVL